ncbi:MAG: hypothetical protein IIZ40_01255 [Bacilli bacterium]|nr:hypothetical protein [Bacilli bacterium]
MTQKELLYLEDAINHEKALIKICEVSSNYLANEDLVSFFEKQIKKHTTLKNNLINLLEDCNER